MYVYTGIYCITQRNRGDVCTTVLYHSRAGNNIQICFRSRHSAYYIVWEREREMNGNLIIVAFFIPDAAAHIYYIPFPFLNSFILVFFCHVYISAKKKIYKRSVCLLLLRHGKHPFCQNASNPCACCCGVCVYKLEVYTQMSSLRRYFTEIKAPGVAVQ